MSRKKFRVNVCKWAKDLQAWQDRQKAEIKQEINWNTKYPINLKSLDSVLLTGEMRSSLVVVFSRESHETQSKNQNHIPKIMSIQQQCDAHGITVVETVAYTGTGKVSQLYQYIDELSYFYMYYGEAPVPQEMEYFSKLKALIHSYLQELQHGEKLYIVLYSIDRLFRPANFCAKNKSTWEPKEIDFEIFTCWLNHHFRDRVKDIIFVFQHGGTPEEIRGIQTKEGMTHRKAFGGRPKNKKTASKKSKVKKINRKPHPAELMSIVMQLRLQDGLATQRISARLSIPIRTVNFWLKKAQLSNPRGNPTFIIGKN